MLVMLDTIPGAVLLRPPLVSPLLAQSLCFRAASNMVFSMKWQQAILFDHHIL